MSSQPPPTIWPHSAQLGASFLLGVAVTLLGVRVAQSHSWGARPLDLERPLRPLDLNQADASELRQLPGVGGMLAGRIVNHRQNNGPFRSVDELSLIPGIGPSTLTQMRPWLAVAPVVESQAEAGPIWLTRKPPTLEAEESARVWKSKPPPASAIDPNRASLAELQQLPGIGPVLAGRILEARDERPFRTVDDLGRVKGIGVKTLAKLRPHLQIVER